MEHHVYVKVEVLCEGDHSYLEFPFSFLFQYLFGDFLAVRIEFVDLEVDDTQDLGSNHRLTILIAEWKPLSKRVELHF